jgi:TolA-binding protein
MAKLCEVCNQPYPDNLAACPHCKTSRSGASVKKEPFPTEAAAPPTAAPHVSEEVAPDLDILEVLGEDEPVPESAIVPFARPSAETPNKPAATGHEDQEIIELAPHAAEDDSEIDLEARSSPSVIEPWAEADAAREDVRSEQEVKAASDLESDSAPDVELPGAEKTELEALSPAEADLELPHDAEEIPALEDESVEDAPPLVEDEEPVLAATENEAAAKARRPREAQRRHGPILHWLGGGVTGALLATAACAGAWFAGLLPPAVPNTQSSAVSQSLSPASPMTQPPAPSASQMPPAGPKAPPVPAPGTIKNVDTAEPTASKINNVVPAASARLHLEHGDFDKALAVSPGSGQQAENRVAQGEARWLAYLTRQKQRKAPLKADDPAVKQARSDLEAAGNADGLFWLGQLQEGTGDLSGARKTYETGAKKFKDQRAQQRLFQAALDRLDALSEGAPAAKSQPDKDQSGKEAGARRPPHSPAPELTTSWGALLLTLLQASPPKPAPAPATQKKGESAAPANKVAPPASPAAAEPEEAGIEFWRAARLAKEFKFEEALQALQTARATHENRRFMRLRKSQNPTSDPTEEIFLRCCDELAHYWQLRAQLSKAGYLDRKERADPIQAMSQALKDATARKAGRDSLQALAGKLKNDPDVARVDPEAKDIAQNVGLLLAAKKKAEEQIASMRSSLQKAQYITEQQPDVSHALEKLLKDREAAENLLQEKKQIASQLRSSGAQLKDAEHTLHEVARKLAEMKCAAPEARGEELVKGVDQLAQRAKTAAASAKAPRPRSDPAEDAAPPAATTSEGSANPLEAEQFYAAGVRLFANRQYSEAEKQFAQAVQFARGADADARYSYFLGLSLLGQGRQDSAFDAFRQGAALERQNKPSSAAVSATFERIQGRPRSVLDRFRP